MSSKTKSISNDYSRLLHFLKTSKKNKNGSLQRKTVNHPMISKNFFDEYHQNSPLVNDDEIGDVDISDIELGMSLYSKSVLIIYNTEGKLFY